MKLPEAGADYSSGIARVSGWGTTSSGGSISDVLRYVDVPIVADKGKPHFSIKYESE